MPITAVAPLPDTDQPVAAWPTPQDVDWPSRREQLVAQHLPLVRSVAGKLAPRIAASSVVDFDDLVGYGCEGLLTAIESFDPGLGYQFSTWAVLHIRTTIQDALRSLDPIGRRIREHGQAIARTSQTLAQTQGAWPSESQLAAALGVSVAQLRQTQATLAMTSVSLDQGTAATGEDDHAAWLDRVVDPDPAGDPQAALDHEQTRGLLSDAIATLPGRDRQIVHAYYQEGASMRTIAARLALSETRISQLHYQLLTRLRLALTTRAAGPGLATA